MKSISAKYIQRTLILRYDTVQKSGVNPARTHRSGRNVQSTRYETTSEWLCIWRSHSVVLNHASTRLGKVQSVRKRDDQSGGSQELLQVALHVCGLRCGGVLQQRLAHVCVQRLGELRCGRPDASAVRRRAEQRPEERKHLLLHQLRSARVQLRHQLWETPHTPRFQLNTHSLTRLIQSL